MTRKLTCTVTGNWTYVSEERYQKLVKKYGSVAELEKKYVSRAGKKLQETGDKAPDTFKNKICCTVTGQLCYATNERWHRLLKKYGSEEEIRKNCISRVAKRLLAEGKTKDEIRAMAKAGTLPSPSAKVKKVDKKTISKPKVATKVHTNVVATPVLKSDEIPASVSAPVLATAKKALKRTHK